MNLKYLLIIYVAYLVIVSIISFGMYGIDKSKAKQNKVRIKEKSLLQVTILGGAIGSFIGRIMFRHKTNKIYFSIIIILSLVFEAVVAGTIIVLM